jgi:hypothetical protein
MISSIVRDFVNQDKVRRYEIVESMTMMILTEKVLIRLHTMTGIINNIVTRKNSIAFAVRCIKYPRYMNTFGLVEIWPD